VRLPLVPAADPRVTEPVLTNWVLSISAVPPLLMSPMSAVAEEGGVPMSQFDPTFQGPVPGLVQVAVTAWRIEVWQRKASRAQRWKAFMLAGIGGGSKDEGTAILRQEQLSSDVSAKPRSFQSPLRPPDRLLGAPSYAGADERRLPHLHLHSHSYPRRIGPFVKLSRFPNGSTSNISRLPHGCFATPGSCSATPGGYSLATSSAT
jgi:hypothetical protein